MEPIDLPINRWEDGLSKELIDLEGALSRLSQEPRGSVFREADPVMESIDGCNPRLVGYYIIESDDDEILESCFYISIKDIKDILEGNLYSSDLTSYLDIFFR